MSASAATLLSEVEDAILVVLQAIADGSSTVTYRIRNRERTQSDPAALLPVLQRQRDLLSNEVQRGTKGIVRPVKLSRPAGSA